LIYPRTTQPKI